MRASRIVIEDIKGEVDMMKNGPKQASYFDKSRQKWTFCWALEGDRCSGGGGWHSERTDGSIPSDHWSDQITRSHQPPQCSLEVITGGPTDPPTPPAAAERIEIFTIHSLGFVTKLLHGVIPSGFSLPIVTDLVLTYLHRCWNISGTNHFAKLPKSPGHHDYNAGRPNMTEL